MNKFILILGVCMMIFAAVAGGFGAHVDKRDFMAECAIDGYSKTQCRVMWSKL